MTRAGFRQPNGEPGTRMGSGPAANAFALAAGGVPSFTPLPRAE